MSIILYVDAFVGENAWNVLLTNVGVTSEKTAATLECLPDVVAASDDIIEYSTVLRS